MLSPARRLASVAALALLVIPLSACSVPGLAGFGGTGASSGSSSGEAAPAPNGSGTKCQVASAAIDGAIQEAQQIAPQLIGEAIAGEPVDAGALVSPVLEAIEAAAGSVTDPAVLTALNDAQAEWTGLAGDITALEVPDLSGLAEGDLASIGAIQSYGEQLSALYSERLPALQDTGATLQAACTAE